MSTVSVERRFGATAYACICASSSRSIREGSAIVDFDNTLSAWTHHCYHTFLRCTCHLSTTQHHHSVQTSAWPAAGGLTETTPSLHRHTQTGQLAGASTHVCIMHACNGVPMQRSSVPVCRHRLQQHCRQPPGRPRSHISTALRTDVSSTSGSSSPQPGFSIVGNDLRPVPAQKRDWFYSDSPQRDWVSVHRNHCMVTAHATVSISHHLFSVITIVGVNLLQHTQEPMCHHDCRPRQWSWTR